ncbi:MAG: magnesium transporter, partial [Planctomycetota bacterium]
MTTKQEELHDAVARALDATDDQALKEALDGVRAADLAELFPLLAEEDRSRLLFALDPHTAAETFIMLGEAVRGDVVEDLDTESLSELVSELPPDDAADFLGELPEEDAEKILDQLEAARSDQLGELLEYEEDSAGGIMTPDVVALKAASTVADAVEELRRTPQEEDLHEIYIVDEQHRPVGTVPLHRLVTSPPHTRLIDICEPDPVVVNVHDDQE